MKAASRKAKSATAIALACALITLSMQRASAIVTFGPAAVNASNTSDNSFWPHMSVSGSNVYVMWEEPAPQEVYFRRSIDGGMTFQALINLSDNAGSSALFGDNTKIASTPGFVHAVWMDDSDSPGIRYEIFYARSTDAGLTFESPVNLSNNGVGFGAGLPNVVASGSNVYVVYDGGSPPRTPLERSSGIFFSP